MRPSIAVMIIIGLAFGLRVFHLAVQSLSYDEAVSAYLAAMPVRDMLSWTAADVQPPLYYLLLRGWTALAGASEFSLRFLSAMFSLTAVVFVYRIARQLDSRPVAVIAALAAAIHPWYVWHAQDARMYSLLLFVGAGSTLTLLQWARGVGSRRRLHLAFLALWYTALLYTHYLGAGLIAAHLVAVAWWARRRSTPRSLLSYSAGAVLPAALLFLPWVPAVLQTVRNDTSYWPGALKTGEAVRKALVALLVGGPGETVIETTGLRIALLMAVVLVLALVARGLRRSVAPMAVCLVTLGTTAAVFLVTPKFNPRYLILASLALPVLWGQAVAPLWEKRSGRRRWAGLVAVVALVAGSGVGLAGMFWDVRLTRTDFRSAITHVLDNRQPDERVLLVSGHLYPVWLYYAPDKPYTPLPKMRVLDIGSSLDLGVADDLQAALAGATGAWLVLWQDDVVDPMGATTFLLDQVAAGQQSDFWHVRVRHYILTDPIELPTVADTSGPASCRFQEGMELLGTLPDAAGNVALLWRASQPLAEELRAQVTLQDTAGHVVLRTHLSPGGDTYPTTLWRPGQVVLTRLDPATPPGIAGGTYRAAVTLYQAASGRALDVLDAAGNPAGQTCDVGRLQLSGNTAGVDPAAAIAYHGLRPVQSDWWPVRLLAAGVCPTAPQPPGSAVSLPLLLQLDSAVHTGPGISIELVSGDGTVRRVAATVGPWTVGAQAGEVRMVWVDWRLPADAPPGPADVRLSASDDGQPQAGEVVLCTLEVAPVVRSYAVPSPAYPSGALLGEAATFLGLDSSSETAVCGEAVHVRLYFQALLTPDVDYTVFVHLLDRDGKVVAEASAQPAGRPTAGWLAGEVVSVEFELTVPADATPGTYTYEVGWFRPEVAGMPRASVTVGGQRLPTDSIILGQLSVR